MNQQKIGKFICECRKQKGYTQSQLAEKLGITDRVVSKWETGKSMPDVSIMLELCSILGININELLTGEKISQAEYQRKAEENMLKIVQKNTKASKEEKIISVIITLSIAIVSVTDYILSKYFTSNEAIATTGIVCFVSIVCFVAIWIATTVSLKNWKDR